MGSVLIFLSIYLLGGLTFLPFLLALVLLHAYYTLPVVGASADSLRDPSHDDVNITSGPHVDTKNLQSGHNSEVAEGYFAVCREYVPGGVNGKPPERTTPAGEVVTEESPSVYQSIYRSLFDRKLAPSLDTAKSNGKSIKKARNVFYVVLRHGHLMLFDDAEQVEVRHVISLAHHNVSVYGGGNELPEGELWIKRNAICLTRKPDSATETSSSKPFYFFSENCSEKEDFYFALLQNQEHDPNHPPTAQKYDMKHMITLIQKLHSSEEHLQTRWLNAMAGRLFLGIYKTRFVEDFVRMKFTKKIARVNKPAFLSGLVLQKIDMGEAAPLITNPRLKDLTVDGECCVEADFKYDGNFRIEIAATVRIELGSRIKAREVQIVLAVRLSKLQGHVLLRFKPPPSNRIWFTFETMPHMEMVIEPIVSSRQITYGVILRAIESRIREVLTETLVFPHWDDSPFMDTRKQRFRGGIWMEEDRGPSDPEMPVPDEEPEDDAETILDHSDSPVLQISKEDRSGSLPILIDTPPRQGLFSRRGTRSTQNLVDKTDLAVSSGAHPTSGIPRAMRSRSFASAADPILSVDNINGEAGKAEAKTGASKNAASFMSELSNRSQPASPTPESTKLRPETLSENSKGGCVTPTLSTHPGLGTSPSRSPSPVPSTKSTESSTGSLSNTPPSRLQTFAKGLVPSEKKQQHLATLGAAAAAAAAKNWTWGKKRSAAIQGKLEHPVGRGRPLPPPGEPLPLPDRRVPTTPKRRPLASLPTEHLQEDFRKRSDLTPPLPRRIRNQGVHPSSPADTGHGELLVVRAPSDVESLGASDDDGFGDFVDNVDVNVKAGTNDPQTPQARPSSPLLEAVNTGPGTSPNPQPEGGGAVVGPAVVPDDQLRA